MIKVNLLKPEKKEVSGAPDTALPLEEGGGGKISPLAGGLAGLITIGAVAFFYFSLNGELNGINKKIEDNRASWTKLEPVRKQVEEMEQMKALLEAKIKVITDLSARKQDAVLMMDKLSRALPPDWVWLTGMTCTGYNITISGQALSNNLVADFITNLQNSNSFINVRLGSTKRVNAASDLVQFMISCTYKPAPVEGSKVG